jgi:hypothetical protein
MTVPSLLRGSLRRLTSAVLMAGTAIVSTAAVAQDSGGVRVGGDVTINARAENVSNRASNGSTADLGVGRVTAGASVGGDVRINATAENISNQADNRSKACVEVGSVGRNACQ